MAQPTSVCHRHNLNGSKCNSSSNSCTNNSNNSNISSRSSRLSCYRHCTNLSNSWTILLTSSSQYSNWIATDSAQASAAYLVDSGVGIQSSTHPRHRNPYFLELPRAVLRV
ncbi:TPA: hypothetical protein ACH3X1_006372 [Trebouxia sp. C0004]